MSRHKLTMQAEENDGIKMHFNPTFEGPMEVGVQLTDGILDPTRHSIVIFKDNSHPIPMNML